MSLSVLLIALMVSFPVLAQATTYWVSVSGGTGSNSEPCANIDGATDPGVYRRSIAAGLGCLTAAGDILNVKAGTYIENVTSWPAVGVAGNPIVVRANPGDTVIWRSPSTDRINSSILASHPAIHLETNYVRIQGFRFEGTRTRVVIRAVRFGDQKSSNPLRGVEILDNTFVDNGHTQSDTPGYMTNVIYIQRAGLNSGTSTEVTITGNTFNDNYGAHIHIAGTSNTLVADNTCANMRGSKNDSNAGWFQAACVQADGDLYNPDRNVIEDNLVNGFVEGIYGGGTYEASGVRFDTGARNTPIRRNVIGNIGSGTWGGTKRAFGMMIENQSNDNTVEENVIYNIVENCIRLSSSQTQPAFRTIVRNNVLYNCQKAGIVYAWAEDTLMENNILLSDGAASETAQIYVEAASTNSGGKVRGGNVWRNNLYWNPSGGSPQLIAAWNTTSYSGATLSHAAWVTQSAETNSRNVNPLFTSPTGSPPNFHVQSNSEACGNGFGGVDIGAYPDEPNCSGGGDTDPPTAPTNVQVTENASHQATLTWTQGTDNIGVTQNKVYWCTGAACTPTSPITISAATSYVHQNLTPGLLYRWQVSALDAAGLESPLSSPVTETTMDAAGLVAHWPCNEGSGNCEDQTAYNHDLALSGNATRTTGLVGANALALDGDGDFAQTARTVRLSPPSQFAISACIKTAATDTNGSEIVSGGDSYGARLTTAGNLHCFRRFSTMWNAHVTTGFNLLDNAKRHVLCQYTGSQMEAYVDGNAAGSTPMSGAINYDLGANVLAGRHGNGSTLYDFNGVLDEVKIADRALSSGEISTEATTCLTNPPTATLSVQHWRYHLPGVDENTAWVADEDTTRRIRSGGYARWRFQVMKTGATTEDTFALTCNTTDTPTYTVLTNDCGTLGVCMQSGGGLSHTQSLPRRLTLPGGGTYLQGIAVMTPAWLSLTTADGEVVELEYGDIKIDGLAPGKVVCCRPAKGDGSDLEDYPDPPGDACLTVHAGVTTIW